MANIFQAELGLGRATCFDVLDACASWIRSLQLAKALITAGTYRTVMILNCELNFANTPISKIERMEDLEMLFFRLHHRRSGNRDASCGLTGARRFRPQF